MADTSRKILIVEDDKDWGITLEHGLNRRGVRTVMVDNPEAVSTALEEGGFTGVITDGLKGGWERVVENAGGLPVKLLTGELAKYGEEARGMGIRVFGKESLEIDRLIE